MSIELEIVPLVEFPKFSVEEGDKAPWLSCIYHWAGSRLKGREQKLQGNVDSTEIREKNIK